MRNLLKISLMVVLMVLLLAACGESEDPSVAFCAALTELNEVGPTIAALGEVADLAQIVQLGAALDNSWKNLSSAVEKMDVSVQTAFAPYNELYTSIPAITQETAMPIGRSSLDAKNAIATDAYDEFYPVHCQ